MRVLKTLYDESNGVFKLESVNLRWSPAIGTNYFVTGRRNFFHFHFPSTYKRISACGNIFNLLKLKTAGNMCPPVPPPLSMILSVFKFSSPYLQCCVTSRMMPSAIIVNQMDVPPMLNRTSGWPATGRRLTATPYLQCLKHKTRMISPRRQGRQRFIVVAQNFDPE